MASHSCTECADTGFVIRTTDGVDRAQRCACRRAGADLRRLEAARIPKRYADCSIESFHPQPTLLQVQAKRAAEEFLAEFPLGSGAAGLLFLGAPGVGKTHLAVSILRGLVIDKAVRGLFYDYGDLLRTIQSTWEEDSDLSQSSVLDPVTKCEVLLLDDLGATRPSLWVQETLFHILNTRYNEERVTLLTSNHLDAPAEPGASEGRKRDLQDAALEHQIGTRLRSRLHEMCRTVEMDGEDFRKTYKRASYSAGS